LTPVAFFFKPVLEALLFLGVGFLKFLASALQGNTEPMQPFINLRMAEMKAMMIFQVPIQQRSIPTALTVSTGLGRFDYHIAQLFPEFRSQFTCRRRVGIVIQSPETAFIHPVRNIINGLPAYMMTPAQLRRGGAIQDSLNHRDTPPFSHHPASGNLSVQGFPGNFRMGDTQFGFSHILLFSQ
jgi:hypothetical protein